VEKLRKILTIYRCDDFEKPEIYLSNAKLPNLPSAEISVDKLTYYKCPDIDLISAVLHHARGTPLQYILYISVFCI
jgi:hypothetical protein